MGEWEEDAAVEEELPALPEYDSSTSSSLDLTYNGIICEFNFKLLYMSIITLNVIFNRSRLKLSENQRADLQDSRKARTYTVKSMILVMLCIHTMLKYLSSPLALLDLINSFAYINCRL